MGAMATPFFLNKTGKDTDPEPDMPGIRSFKTLGRTGFRVSDIGIGAPPSEAVLKAALKSGMN